MWNLFFHHMTTTPCIHSASLSTQSFPYFCDYQILRIETNSIHHAEMVQICCKFVKHYFNKLFKYPYRSDITCTTCRLDNFECSNSSSMYTRSAFIGGVPLPYSETNHSFTKDAGSRRPRLANDCRS